MLGFYSTASRTPARLRPGLFMLDGPSSRTPALPPRPSGTCFVRRAASRGYSPSVLATRRQRPQKASLRGQCRQTRGGLHSRRQFCRSLWRQNHHQPLRQVSARFHSAIQCSHFNHPQTTAFRGRERFLELLPKRVAKIYPVLVRVEVEGPLDLRRTSHGNPPRMIAVSDQSKIYLSLQHPLQGKRFMAKCLS